MFGFNNYNKLVSLNNKSEYPFNLISNLKNNIIETKKEIELEYVKGFKVLKAIQDNKVGGEIKEAGILIYEYTYEY